jgi:CheY-like chemotaxis protein
MRHAVVRLIVPYRISRQPIAAPMPRPGFSRWRNSRVHGIAKRQIVLTSPASFVIVDDVDDNRFLVSKALLRSFPSASIIECVDSSTALAAVQCEKPAAIIVHRSFDLNGPAMIRALRGVTSIPIVMVSGRESCPEAIEAGANAFLNYEAWARIGTVIAEVLSPCYVPALSGTPFKPEGDPLGWRPGAYRTTAQ